MSNVKLMWATPKADQMIAYMARVSNPDNQAVYYDKEGKIIDEKETEE